MQQSLGNNLFIAGHNLGNRNSYGGKVRFNRGRAVQLLYIHLLTVVVRMLHKLEGGNK